MVISTNMGSHRKRNTSTSVMFTLAIAFLVFTQSLFYLIGDLAVKVTASLMGGADIYLQNQNGQGIYEE